MVFVLTGCVNNDKVEIIPIADDSQIQVEDIENPQVESDEDSDVITDAQALPKTDIQAPAPSVKEDAVEEMVVENADVVEPQSRVINVQMKRFEFDPGTIEVNKGDTVTLNLTAVDVAHGLSIAQYGVNVKAGVGETVSVTFVADKAGSFEMRCNVYCGEGHVDMKGTLLVK